MTVVTLAQRPTFQHDADADVTRSRAPSLHPFAYILLTLSATYGGPRLRMR